MTEDLLTAPAAQHGDLSFAQTVPCWQAHRRSLGEVFVADTAQVGTEEFLAAMQIPRAHSLWFDRLADYHDPFAAVEAVRQAMTVIGHRHLQAPRGTSLSLQRLEIEVEDQSAFREQGIEPLEGVVRLRMDRSAGREYFVEHTFAATVTVGNALAMIVRGGGIAFPPEAYEQFRRHQQADREADAAPVAEPVDPQRVGRRDPRNVVVGSPRAEADSRQVLPLVVNRRHPSFFDHEYDHVPGPLMLEGFRQASLIVACEAGALESPVAMATAVTGKFSGFAELDAAVELSCRVDHDPDFGDAHVDIEMFQFGTRIAESRVEVSPYSP
ncbi:AfsA-related hotdog domain-containing protein [Nocardia sp. BMG51109]|uniref:AfsA-related hotdog domain-containing protein n=1 Tax=Nocardia sp. BMG51109 TaxID=1056816 RepID=UPI000465FFC9|nr:AfsA-related hotdog domain-containing protein [Nocardia sp. BMG51109]